ncbi:MAG: adenosylcobinamide-GDP ribazoletransferase [Rhodobacteraceae bacterium]|nr:adenosylcobinamide-GDP ribazoletransferase [Paracoccaceae bacterium]MCY4250599.1 adenosylcobinamide-GDP ribazoletransferase [Paracoccaceae bacterium]
MQMLKLSKKIASDLAISLGLFTRIPVKSRVEHAILGTTVWSWPIIGGMVGLVVGITAEVINSLEAPPELAALIVTTLLIFITGGFHEDGLADSFDGLWGGNTPEKRLEIMKDSRVGTFGVLSLIISIMFRWVLLTFLFESGFLVGPIIVVCVVSRSVLVPFMMILPSARKTGLSSSVGKIPHWSAVICLIISLLPIFLFLGPSGLIPVFFGLLIILPVYFLAKKLLQGQTGDVLGMLQQLVEIGILMTIVLYYTG